LAKYDQHAFSLTSREGVPFQEFTDWRYPATRRDLTLEWLARQQRRESGL
jgi:hypothetical protein